jgi:phosphocarrier protein
MTERVVKVTNRAGIHARPSSLIVSAVNKMKSQILLDVDGNQINAKSILGVITLGAAYGTEIKIIADGEDEQDAVDAIVHLFDVKFEDE